MNLFYFIISITGLILLIRWSIKSDKQPDYQTKIILEKIKEVEYQNRIIINKLNDMERKPNSKKEND